MITVELRRSHYGWKPGDADYEAVAGTGLPLAVEIVAFAEPESEYGYEEAVDNLHSALSELGLDDKFDFVTMDEEAATYVARVEKEARNRK